MYGRSNRGAPRFKDLGATATDHGQLSVEANGLSEWEASRLYDRLRLGAGDAGDAGTFSAHMLMEMARMSADDGLVMQLHPGVWRGHDTDALARFGSDMGYDFPLPTPFTASLQRLLTRFGSAPGFRAVAFTVDETTFSRELAPMASYYPGLWLGAPWWFLDAPDAMSRFWEAVTESAGFGKSAGFRRRHAGLLLHPRPSRPGPPGPLQFLGPPGGRAPG